MPWYRLRSGTPFYAKKPPYAGAREIPAPGTEIEAAPSVEIADKPSGAIDKPEKAAKKK